MEYFFKIGHCTTPKNTLDRQIQEYARALSGTLIQPNCLENFKELITMTVKTYHGNNPRCKELPLYFIDHRNTGEPVINCGSTTAYIYKVKNSYPNL